MVIHIFQIGNQDSAQVTWPKVTDTQVVSRDTLLATPPLPWDQLATPDPREPRAPRGPSALTRPAEGTRPHRAAGVNTHSGPLAGNRKLRAAFWG